MYIDVKGKNIKGYLSVVGIICFVFEIKNCL